MTIPAATASRAAKPVAEARFNGVAERVAEVEERAQAALALVAADDFGLDRDRADTACPSASGSRSNRRSRLVSSQPKNAASRIKPA